MGGSFDSTETVVVTRAMLVAGILVGIGGEHGPVPSQAQVDRAADLIMRAGRRYEAGLKRLADAIADRPDPVTQ